MIELDNRLRETIEQWFYLAQRQTEALERIATALERETPTERVGNIETRHAIFANMSEQPNAGDWYIKRDDFPADIFYSAEADDFYRAADGAKMPTSFYKQWQERRAEFPPAPYSPIKP